MVNQIYQFKVTLHGRGPKVWRRMEVPDNYNFRELHLAIQKSMGWKSIDFNYHLHKFEVKNSDTYMVEQVLMSDDVTLYENLGDVVKNEEHTKITEYFKQPGDKAMYEYDFGHGWRHDVILEKVFPAVTGVKYPRCVAGKMACPPEDGVIDSDEEYDAEKFDPTLCFQ